MRSGDTLSQIAANNGMSLDALIRANPQISNPNLIHPGQAIHLSGGAGGGSYTVRSGDNLSAIAASHAIRRFTEAMVLRGSLAWNACASAPTVICSAV